MESLSTAEKFLQFSLNLKWLVTLEYFEGELLSLFENEEGDLYLYSWCDCDEQYNRWLVFRITPKSLQEYVSREKTFQEIVLNPVDRFFYILDIDGDHNIVNTFLIQGDRLPELYIPEPDSYYDFSDLHPMTKEGDLLIVLEQLQTRQNNTDLSQIAKLFATHDSRTAINAENFYGLSYTEQDGI